MVERKPPLECFVSCDDIAMVICVFTQTRGGGRMLVKKLCKMGATLRETGAALYELNKSYRSRARVIGMYAPSEMWERRSDSRFAPIDVVSAYFSPKEGRIHRMYSDDEEWFGTYIEKIITEHESTTLKLFPNARIAVDGCIGGICPSDLDTEFVCPMQKRGSDYACCPECRRVYWHAEVKDNAD